MPKDTLKYQSALVLFGASIFLANLMGALCAQEPDRVASKVKSPGEPRILPGVQSSGAVQLPNQWSLRPAGEQLELGDFPVNMAFHPDGGWLAVLHAGWGTHEVVMVDIRKGPNKIVSRITLDQAFYGLCFSPDGKTLYASGGEF